jgi:glycosyltransferase involved in cell wall biosynthesis
LPDDHRLILDVTGIASWLGPAVGILRVEQELATYAARHQPEVILAVFNAASFHPLMPQARDTLIGWRGAIDMSRAPGRPARSGWRRWLPNRYPIVMALERARLAHPGTRLAAVWGALQRAVLAVRRHNTPLVDAAGQRFDIVPFAEAVGPPLTLSARDQVLTVGSHRVAEHVDALAALQRATGFALVAMCYDLIPLLLPHCFKAEDVAVFRHHWATLFPICDTVLVTSASAENDVRAHCAASGLGVRRLARVPLGYNPPAMTDATALPRPLEPGRFALFVGTIEPRKGHAVLVAAWRALLARGVPQRAGFRLVFVGRAGWKMEALLREIADESAFEGTLLHLSAATDATLAALYRGAAFCLYPSLYEGCGLPIVEAFAYGKPVIASTGGAVPETVGTFGPCLDPLDIGAWTEHIGAWIIDRSEPDAIAARLRIEFRHPSWAEAAPAILHAAKTGHSVLGQGAGLVSGHVANS